MSQEMRLVKLETAPVAQMQQVANVGPDVGDYMHAGGIFGDCQQDGDLIAPPGATDEVIELLAWERNRRRRDRGEKVGLPLPELARQFPEAYNAMVPVSHIREMIGIGHEVIDVVLVEAVEAGDETMET